MQCYFLTFGCKVNTCETAGMEALMLSAGHTLTDSPETADVIILNSCTVTAAGDHKQQSVFRKLRRSCPDAILVLTGCYPQAYPEAAMAMPEMDIVIGTQERERLPEFLEQYLQNGCQPLHSIRRYTGKEVFAPLPTSPSEGHTRAFLKIQDGCNQFCTYCIIPYARGRCRSKPPEELAAAVHSLAEAGYQEMVLCGINLAFYGKEWGGNLLEAVRICAAEPGIQRIRFGSLEPERMTPDVLDGLAAEPKFCPQFHLSLQSGCDRTLKEMHRHYDTAQYAALCAELRNRFPICSITTDMMVGFPGETEEDFAASLAFARQMQFAKIHVFRYSPRPGTPAANRPDQVPEAVKHQRMQQLQKVADAAQAAFLKSRIGMTLPVLFEREHSPDFHNGHTPDFTPVKIPALDAKKSLRKSIFCVRIEASDTVCCFGQLVSENSVNTK